MKILKELHHPHIITFIGLRKEDNESYIIMEYMNGRDLLTYLRRNKSNLKEGDLFYFSYQIADGMRYLEKKQIIHK